MNKSTTDQPGALDRTGTWILLALIAVLLSTGLRMVHLGADPVPWLEDGGYQIDEGYKTLGPRNLLNFGDVNWNENDGYPGWMSKSPMTQWPYYAAFKTFGLEIDSARLVNLGYTVALFALLGWLLYTRLPACYATLGIVLLTADMGLFLFSRSALFEISITLVTFIAFALAARLPAERHYLALIVLAITGVVTTFLVKESAIVYVAPAILAVLVLALSRNVTLGRKHILYAALVVAGILIMAWLTQASWQHKLDLWRLVTTPQAFFLNPIHTLSPMVLVLAYVVLLDYCLRKPEALFLDRHRLILATVVIVVPIAFTLFKYFPQRYFLPVIPAALLLVVEWLATTASIATNASSGRHVHPIIARTTAGIVFLALAMTLLAMADYYGLRHLPLPLGDDPGIDPSTLLKLYPIALIAFALAVWFVVRPLWPRLGRATVWLLAGLHIAAGIAAIAIALLNPTYDARALGERMRAEAGPDQSIGGDWAPFYFKELPQRVFYMRPEFNNARQVTRIRPDYFLFSDTYYDGITLTGLQENPAVHLGEPIDFGYYRDHPLLLYPIHYNDGTDAERSAP